MIYKWLIRFALNCITNHNILFVKLFQVLSTNQDISPDFLSYFKECTNCYSCYSHDVDHELLDEILQTQNITLCGSRPINAGMIALVYKGYRITDGKYIAIKTKRKNIEARLTAGYNQLLLFYKIAIFLCYPFSNLYSALNLIKVFIDSKDHIMDQCDFGLEIKAMNAFNWEFSELENIKHSDKIIVPMVYNHDNEKRYIAMDFLEGVDCFRVNDEDKIQYMKILATCQTIQILFTSIMHTDPHPGNIIYMNDNGVKKLGIIDFGMHAYIDTDVKMDVAKGLSSLVRRTSVKPITYLRSLTNPPIQFNKYSQDIFDKLNDEALKIIGYFHDGTINEQKIIVCYSAIKLMHPDFSKLELNLDTVRMIIAFASMLATQLYLCNHDHVLYADIMKNALSDLLS